MKNAMQLKAMVKNLAKAENVSAQLVLQNYMLERFLERVSLSPYKQYYIIKGGFLIASLVGLGSRTTMDLDSTIKGFPLNEKSIRKMILEISEINIDDGVTFSFERMEHIRESDDYYGFRISMTARLMTLAVPIKLDITTGDVITPQAIRYKYKLLFENRTIEAWAYPLSTVLAEKLETVISRGDQNTRLRDFYDIYVISRTMVSQIEETEVRSALLNTARRRGTIELLGNYERIVSRIKASKEMNNYWRAYSLDYPYAMRITFAEICDAILSLADRIMHTDG